MSRRASQHSIHTTKGTEGRLPEVDPNFYLIGREISSDRARNFNKRGTRILRWREPPPGFGKNGREPRYILGCDELVYQVGLIPLLASLKTAEEPCTEQGGVAG